jgi:NADH-quinone oxidoreductase subunit M
MDNLFVLLLLPLLGALILAFVQDAKAAKGIAIVTALLTLGLTIPFLTQFVPSAGMQFVQNWTWIPALNIHFHIGVDGISLPLVLLTNGLIPLILLSSFTQQHKGPFYALVLFMQTGLLLVFTALDAFAFYVGWEIALIPIYFICALWGGEDRIRVNLKFFIYTFLGSLLMLIAIIYLHLQVPGKTYELSAFYQLNLDDSTQRWIFWAFFIAFAIKMPLFPFHTWQPDTYTSAPTTGTMLLSGIMLKMGVYGVIRWLFPVVPEGAAAYMDVALWMSIVGIVYASLIAFKQTDAKRLVAYSSISHVGLIAAGIFAWNIQGLQGSMIQMVNHGISVVGLFLVIDIIARQTGTRQMSEWGGIATKAPRLAILSLIIVMGAVGLPLTNGFIGEFLLLFGVYQAGIWYAVFAGLTLIFGAVYMLRMYQKTFLGPVGARSEQVKDVQGVELLVLCVIAGLIVFIGVYPAPLLKLSEPAVEQLLIQVVGNR